MDLETRIASIEKEIAILEISLEKQANVLTKNREKASPIFKKSIEALLQQLGLEKAKVEVELTSIE